MEALAGLAAFSVACNVMQTIHFGLEACTACKRVWEGRSPAPELDEHRIAMQKAAQQLQQSLSSSPSSSGNLAEPDLQKAADDMLKITEKLKKELEEVKADRSSRREVLLTTAKFLFVKKASIKKLANQLEDVRQTMQTIVLISLREKLHQNQTLMGKVFDDSDQQTKDFLQLLKAGFTDLNSLIDRTSGQIKHVIEQEGENSRTQASENTKSIKNIVIGESKATRDFFELNSNRDRAIRIQQDQIDTLLDSLRFPEMNTRKNASSINSNHNGTYEWIFEKDHVAKKNGSQQTTFGDWLQSDESVFWISGRAGSGKSSLIRQLIDDERTKTLLEKWRQNVYIISAFIWSVGSDMQKSQVGLLATLLHQMLSIDNEAAVHILSEDESLVIKRTISDWSKAELLDSIKKTLECKQIAVCLFIDGLDEIDVIQHDGASGLLSWQAELSALANVKMCLGSREEPIFAQRLGGKMRLRLHDLTENDMRKFVKETLEKEFLITQSPSITSKQLQILVYKITSQSGGVFLWVHLVTKSICRGLVYCDDWHGLMKRIEMLPRDLSGLYRDMLMRLNSDDQQLYRAEAATYFNVVLHSKWSPMNTFVMLLESNPDILRLFLCGGSEITEEYIAEQIRAMDTKIHTRCGGLLEMTEHKYSRYLSSHGVVFIHRSARDFLLDTAEGRDILCQDHRSPSQLVCASLFSWNLQWVMNRSISEVWDYVNITCFRSDSFGSILVGTSFETLILNTLSSMMSRRFTEEETIFAVGKVAASIDAEPFLTKTIRNVSPSYAKKWKSCILSYALDTRDQKSVIELGARKITLVSMLLREGANPNCLVNPKDFQLPTGCSHHTPFISFLQALVLMLRNKDRSAPLRDAFMSVTCDFLECGADIETRFIHDMAFDDSSCFGKDWRWELRVQEELKEEPHVVLIDMSILHILHDVRTELIQWIEACAQSDERKDRLREFIDTDRVPPPKIVLLAKDFYDSSSKSLRWLSPYRYRPISKDLSPTSSSVLGDLKKKFQGDDFKFHMDPRDVFHWLVKRGYLLPEGGMSRLVDLPYVGSSSLDDTSDPYPEDYQEEKHQDNSFGMDWSYRPDFDRFLSAFEQVLSSNDDLSKLITSRLSHVKETTGFRLQLVHGY